MIQEYERQLLELRQSGMSYARLAQAWGMTVYGIRKKLRDIERRQREANAR